MLLRILVIANLFLLSLLVWPPGGNLLAFRESTLEILLRMTAAIWIWVAAVLASEYQLLSMLQRRRMRRRLRDSAPMRGEEGWASGAAAERGAPDRCGADRRRIDIPLPEGMGDRRSGLDRRLVWPTEGDRSQTD